MFGDTSLARLIIQLVSKTKSIVAKAHNYIKKKGKLQEGRGGDTAHD